MNTPPPMPVAVLISGRGSNLQALIERAHGYRIVAVVSNRADAAGLDAASEAGIPTAVISPADHPDRTSYDRALAARIDHYAPQLVLLAGFLRILSAAFVAHYAGRLLNIHPSLLPAYPGLGTHQRVLDAGEREHGCSVHFVTEELDGGPLVLQSRVAVLPSDDAAQLGARVLEQEHRIYPLVTNWFAAGRLRQRDSQVELDGTAIPAGGLQLQQLENAA